MNNIMKFIFLGLAIFVFSACDAWDYGEHPQITAVKKIAEYADSNNTKKAPDLDLYKKAGIKIDSTDINATNEYIRTLGSEDVDTQEEIQNVVDNIEAYTNKKPTAKISVQSSIVEVGELVLLDGIESSDSDGEIISYKWKKGDKILHTGIAYDANLTKGRHIIELVVTDNYGATGNDLISVVVKDSDDNSSSGEIRINEAPVANIKVTDDNTSKVKLDGSGSTDDKRIISYKWKDGTKTISSKTYTVDKKGKHKITLTVADDDNKTNSATVNIEVK